MSLSRLTNYLLAHRKRLALTQREVAFLMGSRSGGKVSRHERHAREPELAAVLAYEIIFQRSARELFAGLYREIELDVAMRARQLVGAMEEGQKQTPRKSRKCQSIRRIVEGKIKSAAGT